MQRVKKRIFSGCVCEQLVFSVPDGIKNVAKLEPKRPRFKTETEREEHRAGISRRNHARLVNENFTPESLYSTLTLSNEYEVHTFDEARQLRDNYVRRLRYHYPDARITIYMGRGKKTYRIHFHMLSDGIPEEDIIRLWGMGEVVRVEHLKEHCYYDGVDHGQDYTGLADYLFDHWTPEQGGHRWKQTRNLKKPDAENTKPVKRNYTAKKPPRPPKGFIYVGGYETKYGFLYFKYVKKPPERRRRRKPGAG